MARPLWSGTIQISLVGIAVEIYPATSTTRPISFHEVDRNTLGRIHRQNVSAGTAPVEESADVERPDEAEVYPTKHSSSLHLATQNEPARDTLAAPSQHNVEKADIVKGYEYEKGKYAISSQQNSRTYALPQEDNRDLAIFEGDRNRSSSLEKPYFVMPKAGPQATAFAIVRQSLIEGGMVGVGK